MRKIFLACLSAFVIAMSVSTVSVFADAHYYQNDFESKSSDNFDKYRVQLDDGNWVAQGLNQHIKIFEKNPVTEGRFYIGLDANWQDIGKLQTVRLINNGNGKTYMLFGSYAGSVKYAPNNEDNWQPTAGGFKPELGSTVHFDIVIDFDKKTINYYKNGGSWGGTSMSDEIHQYGFNGLSFVSDMKDSTARPWYIDNLIMTDISDFITPKAEVNMTDSYIDIDFKTALSPEDKTSLNSSYIKIGESGAESSSLTVTSVDNTAGARYRITYSGTPDPNKEYYVEFPNTVTSLFNQKLSDNRVYFTGSGNSVISAIKLIDARGSEEGILSPDDEIAQIKIELNSAIAQSELDNITLTADGETVTAERELNDNVYTMKFDDIIGADKKCVLNIPSSVSEVDNSIRKFTTGDGKFEIRSLKFEKGDGTEAAAISDADSLNAEIINTNNTEKTVYVLFCAYDRTGKMTDFKLEKADLTRKRAEVKIDNLNAGGANKIKGFIIEETQSNESYIRNPLMASVSLTAE